MVGVLLALLITLAIEVPIVAALFPGQRLRMGLCCLVTTGVTNVLMNAALPRVVPSYGAVVLYGELGALLFEAVVYAWFSRPRDIARALVAAGCANAASYLVGVALL